MRNIEDMTVRDGLEATRFEYRNGSKIYVHKRTGDDTLGKLVLAGPKVLDEKFLDVRYYAICGDELHVAATVKFLGTLMSLVPCRVHASRISELDVDLSAFDDPIVRRLLDGRPVMSADAVFSVKHIPQRHLVGYRDLAAFCLGHDEQDALQQLMQNFHIIADQARQQVTAARLLDSFLRVDARS